MTEPKFTLYEAVGLRIRSERQRLDLTTTALAQRLQSLTGDSWPREKVSRYETGYRHVGLDELVMFARALGVSVDHLLVPVDEPTVGVVGVAVDMRSVLSRFTNAVGRADAEVDYALDHLWESYQEQRRLLTNIQRSMKGGTP